jgi:hypothetical protein
VSGGGVETATTHGGAVRTGSGGVQRSDKAASGAAGSASDRGMSRPQPPWASARGRRTWPGGAASAHETDSAAPLSQSAHGTGSALLF